MFYMVSHLLKGKPMKQSKHKVIRARKARAKHMKDLAYMQAVKACWLGDYLDLNNDKPGKFADHGKYYFKRVDKSDQFGEVKSTTD
jgi:hypothetical protein